MDTDSLIAAAAEPQEPTQTEPVAPQEPVVPAEPAAPEAPVDPAMEAITSLTSKVDQLLSSNQEPSPEPQDLLDAIESGLGEPGPESPEGLPGEQNPDPLGQQPDPRAQQELEQLTQYIDSRAQEMLTPFLQEQRESQVRALSEKYPDMKQPEIRDPLIEKVRELARRSGNEALLSDPAVIEMAYLSVKAQRADIGAVPAEQVGENGASLETNAGQSQAGVPSDRDNYLSAVFPGIQI